MKKQSLARLLACTALLTGLAIPGGPSWAQMTTSAMGDDIFDYNDMPFFAPSQSPAIIIDDDSHLVMDSTVGASNGNDLVSIQHGGGALTVNNGIFLAASGTGDTVTSTDVDVDVTINGQVVNTSGAAQDALNFSALGAGKTAKITLNGSNNGSDGQVVGKITGGAGGDTLLLNTNDGYLLVQGAINLGGGGDTITLTGGGTAHLIGAVTADNILINGTGTLDAESSITGDVTFNADGVLDLTLGAVVTGKINGGAGGALGTVVLHQSNITLAGGIGGTSPLKALVLDATGTVTITGNNGVDTYNRIGTVHFADNTTLRLAHDDANMEADFTTATHGTGTILVPGGGLYNVALKGDIGTQDKWLGVLEHASSNGPGNALYLKGQEVWVDTIRTSNSSNNVISIDGDDIRVTARVIENDGNHRGHIRIDNNATLAAETIGTDASRMHQLWLRMGYPAAIPGRALNISGKGYFEELYIETDDTTLNLATADTVLTFTNAISLAAADPVLGITVDGTKASKIVIDGPGNAVDLGAFTLSVRGAGGGSAYIPDGATFTIAEGAAAPVLPGAVTGSGAGANYAFTLDAVGNTIVLGAQRLKTFGGAATTANNASVGAAVEALGLTGNAAISALQNTLQDALGTPGLDPLLETLAPAADAAAAHTAIGTTGQSLSTVETRLAALRGGGAETGLAAGGAPNGRHLWAQGFGRHADQKGRKGVSGYDANAYGIALGADREALGGRARIGAAISYAQTSVRSPGLYRSDIDSYQVTLYGEHDLGRGGAFARAMAAYTFNDNDTARYNVGGGGNNAYGSHNAMQYTVQAKAGRALPAPGGMTVTPHVLAHYTHLNPQDYTEVQTNGLGLTVSPDSLDVLEVGTGASASWSLKTGGGATLRPALSAEYRYDVTGESASSTARFTSAAGAAFNTQGLEPGRHALSLGAGLDYELGDNWTFRAAYDFELKADYTAHSGQVRIGYRF